jgi:enoyl-[acyl-carrier protein] reductase II
VWMGTRFIATQEARGHINYKQKIVDTDEDGTIVTRAHSGKANRMIRNQFTDSWVGRESEIKPYPLQLNEIGEPGSIRGRIEGDVDTGVLAAGQGCGLIDDIPPAGDVVRAVMAEARAVLEG